MKKSTKSLALELGVVRKRSKASAVTKSVIKGQTFKYLIVIDFESTCWESRSANFTQEIIEFPAVLLNAVTGEIEDKFQEYVMPEEHPFLSDFCQKLTGISQEKVESGIPLRVCLVKFTRWLKKLSTEKNIVYNKTDANKPCCTFVTWSDWDLSICLFHECRRKQLIKPAELESWIDIRATYRKFYQRKPNGLKGSLQELGIDFDGREHSGIDDAINTARLVWRMIKDGCQLEITKSLKPTGPTPRPHTKPTHVQTVAPPAGNLHSVKQHSMSSNVISLREKLSVASGTSSSFKIHLDVKSPDKVTPKKDNFQTVKTYKIKGQLTPQKVTKDCRTSTIPSSPRIHVVSANYKRLERSPASKCFQSSTKRTTVFSPAKSCVKTKIPVDERYLASRSGNGKLVGANLSRASETVTVSKSWNLAKGKAGIFGNELSVCRTPNQRPPSSSSSSSSTASVRSATGSESSFRKPLSSIGNICKMTPPLCKCGRRTKRKVAQRPGPNFGKVFYSCPQSSASPLSAGCKFFLWEDNLQQRVATSASPVLARTYPYRSLTSTRAHVSV